MFYNFRVFYCYLAFIKKVDVKIVGHSHCSISFSLYKSKVKMLPNNVKYEL